MINHNTIRPILASFLLLGILCRAEEPPATTCTLDFYNETEIMRAETTCTEIILRDISVPAGVTLNLNLNPGTKLTLEGTISWHYHEWNGPLFNITGTDVEIRGGKNHLLDAKGMLWWDTKGAANRIKPILLVFDGLRNSVVRGINIKNTPNNAIWIEDSEGVVARDIYVNSTDGDIFGGSSTKGVNILRSSNVRIEGITVNNQDDCINIKSGSNISITTAYCSGGYGISIGSVGGSDNSVVENVLVSKSQIENSEYGIRIKTYYQGASSVTNVTYEDIVLKDIKKYGINVEGDYDIISDNPIGVASGGVPIKGLTMKNVTGSVKSSGVNIYIFVKNASDWNWSEVTITGGKHSNECDGNPPGIIC